MELMIELDAILFHQIASSLKVTFALDALHLSKELCKEVTQMIIIIDAKIRLKDLSLFSINLLFDDFGSAIRVLQAPVGYDSAVSHVCFLDVISQFYADRLSKQAIHHVRIISGMESLRVGEKSQFDKFLVSHIVKTEEVSACFLYRTAIILECIRVGAVEQSATTMPETFMQICM